MIFPNRIIFSQDRLFVANTDRHEITIYPITEQGFSQEPKHMAAMFPEAMLRGEIWPASVALIGDRLWVENAKYGMRDGGIYLVRPDGSYEGRVNLPADADPFAMAEFDHRVLVTDYSRDRIYEVSTDGKLLGEFKSPAIQPVIDGIRETRGFYRMVRWGFVGLFVLAFGVGFAVALRLERKAAAEPARDGRSGVRLRGRAPSSPEVALRVAQKDIGGATPAIQQKIPPRVQTPATPGRVLSAAELELLRRDRRVVWMEPSEDVLKRLNWALMGMGGGWVLLTALAFESFWMQLLARMPLYGGFLMTYIPLLMLVLGYDFRKLRNVKIGTYQDLVIVVDRRARAAVGKGSQIDYSERFLAIGDVVVPLGAGILKLFDDFMLVSHLHPRLSSANPLPLSQAILRQFKSYFPANRSR